MKTINDPYVFLTERNGVVTFTIQSEITHRKARIEFSGCGPFRITKIDDTKDETSSSVSQVLEWEKLTDWVADSPLWRNIKRGVGDSCFSVGDPLSRPP
jgi:hypothetical protein